MPSVAMGFPLYLLLALQLFHPFLFLRGLLCSVPFPFRHVNTLFLFTALPRLSCGPQLRGEVGFFFSAVTPSGKRQLGLSRAQTVHDALPVARSSHSRTCPVSSCTTCLTSAARSLTSCQTRTAATSISRSRCQLKRFVALRHQRPVIHAVLDTGPLYGGVAVPRPRRFLFRRLEVQLLVIKLITCVP